MKFILVVTGIDWMGFKLTTLVVTGTDWMGFKLTTLVVTGNDWKDNSNYHTIKTMTVPIYINNSY
jgi:hypothetical protein